MEAIKVRPSQPMANTSCSKELPKTDVTKPKEFAGIVDAKEVKNIDAKEVENFLWQIKRYLKGIEVEDETAKENNASYFLIDNVMLWWKRKYVNTKIEVNKFTILIWEDFKKELKK